MKWLLAALRFSLLTAGCEYDRDGPLRAVPFFFPLGGLLWYPFTEKFVKSYKNIWRDSG